ncbi:hypothetical protein PACTADRAFT_51859 [Pachysolen tannophilus NRRL Y-2460]|uniref:Maintenance of mitochondrial morphology protein 1 n=1 Tax=Pachysolen tannophilus NRRL Y-2460 TaxID=669874 RepID=A0A1E4TNA6_PACTA|nr:hypothetical protein PACTADRAFT_51859 [Pachysolen tannophilus NRRL Y-2460]
MVISEKHGASRDQGNDQAATSVDSFVHQPDNNIVSDGTLLTAQQLEQLQNQYLQQLIPQISKQQPAANWSFTQGLLLGQFSVIFIIAIFIKFFVFSEGTSTRLTTSNIPPIINKKSKTKTFITSNELDANLAAIDGNRDSEFDSLTSSILEKTYYNVETHQPESLDWFNVLIAQTISQFREEALNNDNIYHSLTESLSKAPLPDYLDKIRVTEIDIGNDFPIFSNCRIKRSPDHGGRLEAKIDVDLSDTLTLGIETKLLLNHPKPLTAVLPVSLSVSIVRFSGCLSVSLISTSDEVLEDTTLANIPSSSTSTLDEGEKGKLSNGTALMFSFASDYRLEFEVRSLIGARSKLQDVPKIGNLVESKLREWFVERCIEPRFQLIKLPSIWPRKKNTREPLNNPSSNVDDNTSTLNAEEDS